MSAATISVRPFGVMADGRPVAEYTLDNGRGLRLSAINLGGIVTALEAPDRLGRSANVVLGFDNLADYVERNPHFGMLVGRYANRIAGARFSLDGREHRLAANEGANVLHGGPEGFGRRWWAIREVPAGEVDGVAIDLTLSSNDGDQGFPGRLDVTVRYTLGPTGSWRVDYRAECDRPTVVNLTQHSYFNLAGSGSALDHELTLHASRFLETDEALIPTQAAEVAGSAFDFRRPRRIAERIRDDDARLRSARGYDHCYVLDRPAGRSGLFHAARLCDPLSGRVLDLDTTEPALQFYSGNFLDGRLRGRQGQAYRQGDGLCLETQHHPDAPNRADFPSTVLRPGEIYQSTTVHRFGVDTSAPITQET